ncbi:MAG: hypothetical protein LBO78_02750 [Rickettsiales bacterium]|jgi:hypothetical protein|nr:hypothetical protein [Rickettsiales bacterium]
MAKNLYDRKALTESARIPGVNPASMAPAKRAVESAAAVLEKRASDRVTTANKRFLVALDSEMIAAMETALEAAPDDEAALNAAIDKRKLELSGEIEDENLLEEFYADVDLRRRSYANRVRSNRINREKQDSRDATALAIDDDMNAAALSMENLLSGNLTEKEGIEEEFALVHALEDFQSRLSERNPYGEYNLTGAQSAAQIRKMQGVMFGSAVNSFKALPDEAKPDAARRVLEDKAFAGRNQNLKDILYPADYGRMKVLARDYLSRYEKGLANGMASADASAVANRHVINRNKFDAAYELLKAHKTGKPDFANAKATDLLNYREELQLAFKNDDISRDDFKKYMADTTYALVEKSAELSDMAEDWYIMEPGAFTRGLRVINDFIRENGINDPLKQAYLYEEFYERGGKKYEDSSDFADITMARGIAGDVAKSYLRDVAGLPSELETVSAALNGMDLIKVYNVSARAASAPYKLYSNGDTGETIAVYKDGTRVYQYGKKDDVAKR